MSGKSPISRRTMLRGLGTAVALPFLDAMLPAGGLIRAAEAAGVTGGAGAAAAGKAAVAPLRMCMMFMPNGMNYAEWTPSGEGKTWELSKTLSPLAKVKNDVMVLSGLALDNARAKGDGPGDHARSAAAFLTGAHPFKTAGKDIKVGVSVDQYAAQKIGSHTRLPSLELGLDKTRTAGNCDSGYSCAYVSNISWRSENQPVPHEVDPAALFDRLFGAGGSPGGSTTPAEDREAQIARAKRMQFRKSVLDFVTEDSRRLQKQLGRADQDKLDEFTTSIREIEKRVESARAAAAGAATAEAAKPAKPDMARPDGIPGEFSEHMKLMCDLMVLAWRMDITRVSTLMVARDGSDRTFPEIGVTEGHHALSHHGGDKGKVEQIRKIDQYHMQQVAYFIEKLKATPEGNGSMLDNCMVMVGAGISDGNRHDHDNLPILLAGKAGGHFAPGRHVRYAKNTPLCNLYVSMLNAAGAPTANFGDSTGPLTGLNG